MGGKAIKNARRMNRAEHDQLFQAVRAQLEAKFPHLNLYKLRDYTNKADFGNLSFVAHRSPADTEQMVRDYLKNILGNGTAYENGDFIAIGVNGFQLDVTFVDQETSAMFQCYHAYNGLGALIGKVAHSMGLILRDTGLYYREMDGSVLVQEFSLCQYWQGVLGLLDYNYARWEEGFKDLADIFQFVASSPNFRPELFHVNEPVDTETGPTVAQLFSQWLQAAPSSVTRRALLDMLSKHVHGFADTRSEVLETYARDKQNRLAAREKYTGDLVSQWTGRIRQDLGMLMKHMEDSFGGKAQLQVWVLANPVEHIRSEVMLRHAQLRQAAAA